MTLPDERTRSLIATQQFLVELLDSKLTPKVPAHIRQRAHALLRHHPSTDDLLVLATHQVKDPILGPVLDAVVLKREIERVNDAYARNVEARMAKAREAMTVSSEKTSARPGC